MGRDVKMGVQLDGSRGGYSGRLEIVEGRTGRQQRSDAEKARIVAESLMPGSRVAEVARQHGTTRWQIYDWRRRARAGRLVLPVETMPAGFAALMIEAPAEPEPGSSPNCIEVVVGEVVIRAARDADDDHLRRVIRAVRAAT
jgi:transposase